MTPTKKQRAQQALPFLAQKRDEKIEARTVHDGSEARRDQMSKEDTASPTVTPKGLMMTTVINAEEGQDIVMNDAPNCQFKLNHQRKSMVMIKLL